MINTLSTFIVFGLENKMMITSRTPPLIIINK